MLDSIDTATLVGLRDRALIGVMTYAFARVSAALAMRVRDYYTQGYRSYFRLHEKGGKFLIVPAHHVVQEYMAEYIQPGRPGRPPEKPVVPVGRAVARARPAHQPTAWVRQCVGDD